MVKRKKIVNVFGESETVDGQNRNNENGRRVDFYDTLCRRHEVIERIETIFAARQCQCNNGRTARHVRNERKSKKRSENTRGNTFRRLEQRKIVCLLRKQNYVRRSKSGKKEPRKSRR